MTRPLPRRDELAEVLRPRTNRRAVAIGAAGAVLVHLLGVGAGYALPAEWFEVRLEASPAATQPVGQEFDFRLEPESPEPALAAAPPDRPRYFEVNPNAPVNPPERADLFSFQDQQAAAPEPVPGPADEPPVEGADRLTGRLLPGSREAAAAESEPPAPPADAAPPEPRVALLPPVDLPTEAPERPEAPAREPDSPPLTGEGLGPAPAVTTLPERVERALERPVVLTPDARAGQPRTAADPNRPLPRPRLAETLPGEVEKRAGGTSRVGMVAVNARFNEYGEYLRRMWEAITVHWYSLADGLIDSLVFPSEVTVRFVIDQQGRVVTLEVLESTAGTTGTLICRDAIQSRSPFGPFTEDMRRTLRPQEELLVRFSYY